MKVRIQSWGLVPYSQATERQLEVLAEVQAGAANTLIFVEHPPVLTLGANFHDENLLLSTSDYEGQGIEVYRTDRGGDVTYHGPGQLVIYPIFNLERVGKDLHLWLRNLEETILDTLSTFGIEGRRFPPHTGAWIGDLKVAAIGIKIKRWVSMHGISVNCNNDLAPFSLIVPCGIQSYGVTSISQQVGVNVSPVEVQTKVERSFSKVFGISEWE